MEYNTKRGKLVIPEYGRNVQKMVDYCMTIENRELRNAYAEAIITAMGQVSAQTGTLTKESPNYKQTLWDHLFIISDYRLDVDSPYPKPVREEKDEKPTPLRYKDSQITFRPYGALLEKMIKKVSDMEDSEEKQYLVSSLAQELKKNYLQWNINSCDDEVIVKHFDTLSNGKLHLEEDFKFKSSKELIGKKSNSNAKNSQQNRKKKNNNKK